MIFVTVGTQLPFDRLIDAVDRWAQANGRDDVFAQIGPSMSTPRHIAWAPFLTAQECVERIQMASVVVAHAGMGTIIGALEHRKPIIVMPRRSGLREHRNDHQLATVSRLRQMLLVNVASDETELRSLLDRVELMPAPAPIASRASPQLLRTLRTFVSAVPFDANSNAGLDLDPESLGIDPDATGAAYNG